jgi:hypothetical protein
VPDGASHEGFLRHAPQVVALAVLQLADRRERGVVHHERAIRAVLPLEACTRSISVSDEVERRGVRRRRCSRRAPRVRCVRDVGVRLEAARAVDAGAGDEVLAFLLRELDADFFHEVGFDVDHRVFERFGGDALVGQVRAGLEFQLDPALRGALRRRRGFAAGRAPEVPDVFTSFLYEAEPIGITRARSRMVL